MIYQRPEIIGFGEVTDLPGSPTNIRDVTPVMND